MEQVQPPTATPFTWHFGTATFEDGKDMQVLQLRMVTGEVILFMSKDDLVRFGRSCVEAAGGLTVPDPSSVPPILRSL